MAKRSHGLLDEKIGTKKSKFDIAEESEIKVEDLENFSSSDESFGSQDQLSSSSFEVERSSDTDGSDIFCDSTKPVIANTWKKVKPPEPPKDIKSKFSVSKTGPCRIENCKNPIDFLNLFLSESVFIMMVHHTNAFAKHQLQQTKITRYSRFNKWHDITIEEMKKFVGILISMGLTRRTQISDYWSTKPSQFIPFYSNVMSIKRFQNILSVFHLTSNLNTTKNESGRDLLKNVYELLTVLNASFKDYFVPGQAISVSEGLIGAKKYSTLVKYVPKKNLAQHNIKKIILCDSSSGYVFHSALIKYRDRRVAGLLAKRVIMEVLNEAQLTGKGHHIFADNSYTTFGLSRELLTVNTYLTGILSKKSSEFKSSIIQTPSKDNNTLYFRKGAHLLVKYKEATDKKTVNILTTGCHAEDKLLKNTTGKQKAKPLPLYLYNKHKVSIDSKRKRFLTTARMTRAFWKRIVYSLIDIAVLNAFVLYKANTTTERRVDRLQFILEIVEKLSLEGSPSTRSLVDQNIHQLSLLPGENSRICEVCRSKPRSRNFCPGCNVGVHPECFEDLNHYPRPNR